MHRPIVRRFSAVLALLLIALLGTCSTAFARPAGAGLTLVAQAGTPAPKVTKQPSNLTVEEGQSASFSTAASGSPSLQWELSSDGGTSWHAIEGASSSPFTITATNTSESGNQYRALFVNAGGEVTSKAATLTVTKAPVVTGQPHDAFVEEGQSTSFEASASGSPAPTVQWQSSVNGGSSWKSLSGATSSKLTIGGLKISESGIKYRAIFKNTAGEAISEAATLTVREAPKISRQPLSATVIEGQSVGFGATATGVPSPTVQWEISTDSGATWTPIAGATSIELTIPATVVAESGHRFRAVFTNAAGSLTSNAVTLTVQAPAAVTLQPVNAIVEVGGSAAFEAAASGNPAPAVQWEISTNHGASWSPIGGATSERLTITGAQLTDSGHEFRAVFKSVAGGSISAAATLIVSTTDFEAVSWGLNSHGQLGVGSAESQINAPIAIGSLKFVTAVAGGQRHSLALLADGSVCSWGYNGHGQLGDEGAIGTRTPIRVEGLAGVKAIAAGANDSLALLSNGTVMAWGDDESGQLGNGRSSDSEVPVAVQGLSGVTAIAAGEEHSLALLSNGTVMAWGSNERGQLGTGNGRSSSTPVPVKGLTGVTAIAAGGQFSLALLSNGTVEAWGDDEHAQLGNGAFLEAEEESEAAEEEGVNSDLPLTVDGLTDVGAIAAGRTHSLALLADGTVEAWGDDSEGELGNAAIEPRVDLPAPVHGLTGVSAITAGDRDSLALLGSGSLESWGSDSMGNLGIGTSGAPSDVPVAVLGLNAIVGISAGGSHMLAFGETLPAVAGLSPSGGPMQGGTTVTIAGSALSGATAVRFGSVNATSFTVDSRSSITAIAPPGTGTVDVTVSTPSGTSHTSAADRYSYLAQPSVSKVSVKTGPASGGTSLTITGANLTGASEVDFAGTPASQLTVLSPTSIAVVSPPGAAGTADVTVLTAGGRSATSAKDRFKYTPTVEVLAPGTGSALGGTSVTVTGAGFATGTTATKFKFGKATAKSVDCTSLTSCTVIAPAQAKGTVTVVVTVNKAKSAKDAPSARFTYD